jgi:predicted alpha/beta-hydrolase family hydrolase
MYHSEVSEFEPLTDLSADPPVHGFLHRSDGAAHGALVLTHGAGGNVNSPLLVALADAFAQKNLAVLRCDLPFRQRRATGPPRGSSDEDQAGLRRAVEIMKRKMGGRVFLGGQSYGGRMATMLAASKPELASALLVLSYPLHPPGKPEQLRTKHLATLATPALFASGDKDPFGSPEELRGAIQLIKAKTAFLSLPGVGHDLGFSRPSKKHAGIPAKIVDEFVNLLGH